MDTLQTPFTQPQTITLTENEQCLDTFVTTKLDEIFENRTIVFNTQCCPLQEMTVQAEKCISLLEQIPCSMQVKGLLERRIILELYTDLSSLSECPSTCVNNRSAILLGLQRIIASSNTPFIFNIFASKAEANGKTIPSDAAKQATEGLVTLVRDCLSTSFPEIQMHNALTHRSIINLPNLDACTDYIDFFFLCLIKFYDDVLNYSLNMLDNVNIHHDVKTVVIYRVATQLYQEANFQFSLISLYPYAEEVTALNNFKKRLLSLIAPEAPRIIIDGSPGEGSSVFSQFRGSNTYECLHSFNNPIKDTLQSSTLPTIYNNLYEINAFADCPTSL